MKLCPCPQLAREAGILPSHIPGAKFICPNCNMPFQASNEKDHWDSLEPITRDRAGNPIIWDDSLKQFVHSS